MNHWLKERKKREDRISIYDLLPPGYWLSVEPFGLSGFFEVTVATSSGWKISSRIPDELSGNSELMREVVKTSVRRLKEAAAAKLAESAV